MYLVGGKSQILIDGVLGRMIMSKRGLRQGVLYLPSFLFWRLIPLQRCFNWQLHLTDFMG